MYVCKYDVHYNELIKHVCVVYGSRWHSISPVISADHSI